MSDFGPRSSWTPPVPVSELPKKPVLKYPGYGVGQWPRPDTISERLKNYTVVDGCWLWNGWTTSGYGRIKVRGKGCYAHCVSYVQHVGLIPAGMAVRQLCGNRRCINPDHLWLESKRKLTEAQVIEVRRRYVDDPTASHASLAVEFGVAQTSIHAILCPHLGGAYSSVPDADGYVWRPLRKV